MSKTKIIFTADDFGVDDSINEGITNLVKWNIINSVEVFPNYGLRGQKSIANTLKLLDEVEGFNDNLELGVHMTITSGRPLTNTPGLKAIKCNGYFKSFKTIPSTADVESVRKELIAQVEVFKSNERIWKKITHITNHHDTLWFYPEYTKVYIEVANKYKLPIRSHDIKPQIKESSYNHLIVAMPKSKMDRKKIINTFKLREQGKFPNTTLKFQSTEYLDSSYYGFWNRALVRSGDKPEKRFKSRQDALEKVLKRAKKLQKDKDGNLIVEALFHIRKGSVGQTQQKIPRKQRKKLGKDAFGKFDLKDYNGIDTQYFDGRTIEYNALAWAHNDGFLKKWFEEYNMETGKWKETVPKSLVKHLGSALLLPIND